MITTRINQRRCAAALGFIAILCGALAAHGKVHDFLVQNRNFPLWSLAVSYQLLHALVLLFLSTQAPKYARIYLVFLVSILFFSGSLYLLALTSIHWLRFLTPVGGIGFLIAWGSLFFAKD